MSILIGIICNDGIAIGSDSQTTDEWGIARTDASKIFKIDLADGASGLVGMTGNVEWGLQIIEIMEELAKTTNLTSGRSFADLAEKANILIKQKERQPFRRSSKDLQKHFEERRCVLMISNYFKKEPHIFTLTSDGLVSPTRLKKQLYTSLGNSYALANYILGKFDLSEMMIGIAHILAIYVLNEVINAKDSTCFYPIQIGFAFPNKPDVKEGESYTLIMQPAEALKSFQFVINKTKDITKIMESKLLDAFLESFESMTKQHSELTTKQAQLEATIAELKKQKSHE